MGLVGSLMQLENYLQLDGLLIVRRKSQDYGQGSLMLGQERLPSNMRHVPALTDQIYGKGLQVLLQKRIFAIFT